MAGSIKKRGKDTYRLTVSGGFDHEGKRTRHTKTVKCGSRQVEKELAKMVTEIDQGLFIGVTKFTFKTFVEKWLADYAATLAPKTFYRYTEVLESRIVPVLGHLKLENIKPLHVIELVNTLKNTHRIKGRVGLLAPRTVQHHFRILSNVLQAAVQWQLIQHNPCARVKPPKVAKSAVVIYDEHQTAQLIRCLESEPLKYKTLVMLALSSGCRRGEITGLTWENVDFVNSTIKIVQSSQYLPGKGIFIKTTKTESSKRLIAIPPFIMAILSKHKIAQNAERLLLGDKWDNLNMVFTTLTGGMIFPDSVTNWFDKFLKKHGLPHVCFHSLRHLSATLLIDQGINIKAVSSRLGHSSVSTTIDIYSHSLQSADRLSADKMEQLFKQA